MAVVTVLASHAIGQVGGDANWLWNVTTQDGDAIVEPGETATVTLSIDFHPDADVDGPVQGLGTAYFDTAGLGGAANGTVVGWQVLNDLDNLSGDTTTTDGVSLFGTSAIQLTPFPGFVHDDPIDVLQFEWQTENYSSYQVEYATFTSDRMHGDHMIIVWEGDDLFSAKPYPWPIEEAAVVFEVVPAPAASFVVVAGMMANCKRRRRGIRSPFPW